MGQNILLFTHDAIFFSYFYLSFFFIYIFFTHPPRTVPVLNLANKTCKCNLISDDIERIGKTAQVVVIFVTCVDKLM